MKLTDVMQTNVETIPFDAPVRRAAERMRELNVGALPVCGATDRIVGMITDRDIIVRSIANGDNPDERVVEGVMTREIEWCSEHDSIDEVSRRMGERQIQRVVVLDDRHRLLGIVSIGDLARAEGNAPAVTRAMENIKRPTKSTAAGADRKQIGH